MAVDVSKNAFELFSGKKRTRPVPTLAIAVIVTALVAVPFTVRAIDVRNDPPPVLPLAPADAATVVVDTVESDPGPLDRATVAGAVLISLQEPAAQSVSFNLYAAGSDEPLLASQDQQGPQFDLLVSESGGGQPLDSSLLADGEYELFLTITGEKEQRRTAVSFVVANS